MCGMYINVRGQLCVSYCDKSTLFLRQNFSLDAELPEWLGCLVSKLQWSSCFCVPSTGVYRCTTLRCPTYIHTCIHAFFFLQRIKEVLSKCSDCTHWKETAKVERGLRGRAPGHCLGLFFYGVKRREAFVTKVVFWATSVFKDRLG